MDKHRHIINGEDITDLIEEGGARWSRNDIDSPKSGRKTMNGEMERSRVAIKYRVDFTIRRLNDEQVNRLMKLIEPVFVTYETFSPYEGHVIATVYSNNVPATQEMIDEKTGTSYWTGITFPLIWK